MTSGGYTNTEAWNLQLQHKIEQAEVRAEQAEAKLAEVTAERDDAMARLLTCKNVMIGRGFLETYETINLPTQAKLIADVVEAAKAYDDYHETWRKRGAVDPDPRDESILHMNLRATVTALKGEQGDG